MTRATWWCALPADTTSPSLIKWSAADILFRMTRPELLRRVERTEEDLTAISEIVLDIKETVDRHTDTLAEHGRMLADHGRILADHGRILAEHGRILTEHGRILTEHGRELFTIKETQAQHGEMLVEILRRLDAR